MRREPPDRLLPAPRSTVAEAPFVQATVTVPVPLRAVVALTTTGSYAPNATGDVLMVQTAATEAETFRFVTAEAANAAGVMIRLRIARERIVRFIVLLLLTCSM